MEERSELARKFKYYHKSVRPSERLNVIETVNGTFFALNAEVEILQSKVAANKLHLGLSLITHFFDDRLTMRELADIVSIPDEFEPWLPHIYFLPASSPPPLRRSIHLMPRKGQITVMHTVNSLFLCSSVGWKHPFGRYQCDAGFGIAQADERLFLRSIRDLRSEAQVEAVNYQFDLDEWPELVFRFSYHSPHWLPALANFYLPSVLLFSASLVSQMKRRKIQVVVTLSSLLALIIMQQFQASSLPTGLTLKDVWLCGLTLHLVCILVVDLLLPSRRIVYTAVQGMSPPKESVENLKIFSSMRRHQPPTRRREKAIVSEGNRHVRFYNANAKSGGEEGEKNLAAEGVHESVEAGMRLRDQHQLDHHHHHQRQRTLIHPTRFLDDSDVCEEEEEFSEGAWSESPTVPRLPFASTARWGNTKSASEQKPALSYQYFREAFAGFHSLGRLIGGSSTRESSIPPGYRITVGRKKKAALIAIIASYTAFVISYIALVLHAISS